MTDTATTEATETTTTETTEGGDTPTVESLQAEVEKWQSLARKHEDRSKANATAAKELETFKQATMSDMEKAVATAKAEARAEALKEAASKVALASLKGAAKGRLEVTDDFLAGVNLAAFIDDDGEVDEARITKFVDGIAPAKTEDEPAKTVLDLGQGARGGPSALNGDPLLRDLKSKLGIR